MKICKACNKPINNTYNKKRNTHKECKEAMPYVASEKMSAPFVRKIE